MISLDCGVESSLILLASQLDMRSVWKINELTATFNSALFFYLSLDNFHRESYQQFFLFTEFPTCNFRRWPTTARESLWVHKITSSTLFMPLNSPVGASMSFFTTSKRDRARNVYEFVDSQLKRMKRLSAVIFLMSWLIVSCRVGERVASLPTPTSVLGLES